MELFASLHRKNACDILEGGKGAIKYEMTKASFLRTLKVLYPLQRKGYILTAEDVFKYCRLNIKQIMYNVFLKR